MTRQCLIVLVGAVAIAPVSAVSARASSITTYGIIITTLGNDLQVQSVDQAGAKAAMVGGAVSDTSSPSGESTAGGSVSGATGNPDSSLLVTPSGSGGFVVTPIGSPAMSSGGPSGTDSAGIGGSAGGVTGSPAGNSGNPVTVGSPVTSTVNPTGSTTVTTPIPVPAAGDSGTVTGVTSLPATPPGTEKTPEPASLTLLALAGLGGFGYSRRRRA